MRITFLVVSYVFGRDFKRQFRFILPAVCRKAFRSCVIRRFHLQRHDPVQAVFQEKVNLGTVAASPIIRPNPKSGQFCHTVVLGESTFKRCISFRLSQNSAVSYACISAQEAKVRPICLEKGCVRAGGKRDLRSRYHLQTIWGAINLLEGYGNDNPGAKSQGMKQLMAGGGVALIGTTLVPLLSGLFG